MQVDWLPTGRQTNFWKFKQLATSSTSYLFDEDSWIWYLLKLLENLRSSRAGYLRHYDIVLSYIGGIPCALVTADRLREIAKSTLEWNP